MGDFSLLAAWAIWPALSLASRIVGALLFLTAAWGKLKHFDEFVGLVARYKLTPYALARSAAFLIVGLELIAALSLLTGFFLRIGAGLAVALLAGFAFAMLAAWLRGERELDCGCFQSALRQRVEPALIVRNFLLIALVLPAMLPPTGTLHAGTLIDGVGAGVTIFLLVQAFGNLLALQHARSKLSTGGQ